MGGKSKFKNIIQGDLSSSSQEAKELFSEVRKSILKGVSNNSDQELILLRLTEFENSINTENCSLKYQDFIATTANYMTIMAPFIPALTKLIV